MTDTCKACAFYADHANTSTDNGLCHANPPTPDGENRAIWPTVSADDWCGRFEAQVA
ncbi:MAG: hypothetical protein AAFQ04_02335 [Pseudomonadota bacterium]